MDTVELARHLVGKVVAHDVCSGQTLRRDRRSGSLSNRRQVMRSVGRGRAIVRYLSLEGTLTSIWYSGSPFVLNVTSEVRGVGGGVLLRALEPLEGIDLMQRSRAATGLTDLAKGPGRLTEAMRINVRQDGLDLCAAGPLWLPATA